MNDGHTVPVPNQEPTTGGNISIRRVPALTEARSFFGNAQKLILPTNVYQREI